MSNLFVCYAVGGIGDILLCRNGIKNILTDFNIEDPSNLTVYVASHSAKGAELLFDLNVRIIYQNYKTAHDLHAILSRLRISDMSVSDTETWLGDSKEYVNNFEDSFNFGQDYLAKVMRYKEIWQADKYIGIHPFGSEFSTSIINHNYNKNGKNIKPEYVERLIDQIQSRISTGIRTHFLLFCSPGEKSQLEHLESNDVSLICYDDLRYSLTFVNICDLVIAADSAIKSYAAINKVKSIVLLEDYSDPYRDMYFIEPYKNTMSVIRYTTIDNSIIERTINEVLNYYRN